MAAGLDHSRFRTGLRQRHRPMSEINVTPFVDVMLVLLVVFMITAPLLTVGVPIDLPKTAAPALEGTDEPLEITVDAGGAIYLQETATELEELVPRLIAITKTQARGQDLRARRRRDRLRAHHAGDGHDHRGRLHAGGADHRLAGRGRGADTARGRGDGGGMRHA